MNQVNLCYYHTSCGITGTSGCSSTQWACPGLTPWLNHRYCYVWIMAFWSSCSSLKASFSMSCTLVQVSIIEQYQHYYRYLERGGADNIPSVTGWSSPEDSRQNCQGWCKSWFFWGYTSGPLPWWGKCYDAANSLNNIVVALAYNQLIPPATKRMVNETQCNRMNSFLCLRAISCRIV